jgi:DNA-binding beta-propeller fold protein YncE
MSLFTSSHPRAGRLTGGLLCAALIALLLWAFPRPVAHGAGRTDDQTLLLVADLRGHALLVFDPAWPQEARRIVLPGGPHELALLPDGRVVTSLEQAGLLALVDLGSGAVETIAVGGFPHGLVVGGGALAFTDRDRDEVRRLRLDDWAELDPVPAGHWPHAVATLANGALVVANAGDDTLTIGARALAVPAMPETVAVSARGDRVGTAGAMGDTVELLGADGAVQAQVEVGGRPVRVVFDPAGERMAVALSAAGAVALVDAGGAVRRIAVGGMPDGLSFDAGGRLLYVSDLTEGRLTAIDVASGRTEAVYTGAGSSTGALLPVTHRGAVGGLLSPLVRQ